ncbi:MAG: STAS domain-containing protein [Nannocystaceae bacterium]
MSDADQEPTSARPSLPEELVRDIRALSDYVRRAVLDAIPEPVGIYRFDGVLLGNNVAFERFWQLPQGHSLVGNLNLLVAPGVDPSHVAAFRRSAQGETVRCPPVAIDLTADASFEEVARKVLWMEVITSPIHDPEGAVRYVMITFRDCTQDVVSQEKVSETEAQLRVQRETIDALRAAQERIRTQQDIIRELSTPIIEIWPGVLTLPVVGHVDARRGAEMTERLLEAVSSLQARVVILDLTGVEHIDTATAHHLLGILRAVPLLGGEPMIAGIHPSVAQTIVELGVDLTSIRTVRNLRSALAEIIPNAAR